MEVKKQSLCGIQFVMLNARLKLKIRRHDTMTNVRFYGDDETLISFVYVQKTTVV